MSPSVASDGIATLKKELITVRRIILVLTFVSVAACTADGSTLEVEDGQLVFVPMATLRCTRVEEAKG